MIVDRRRKLRLPYLIRNCYSECGAARMLPGLPCASIGPGCYDVFWDGRSADGEEVPFGVCIAHLMTLECTRSIKMLLLK